MHGKITDAISGEILPGVIIYLPQLKLGASSDSTGAYNISSVPNGSYTIEARSLSYATAVKQVKINGVTTVNFSLSASANMFREVIVTALGNSTNTQQSPEPVTLVNM